MARGARENPVQVPSGSEECQLPDRIAGHNFVTSMLFQTMWSGNPRLSSALFVTPSEPEGCPQVAVDRGVAQSPVGVH